MVKYRVDEEGNIVQCFVDKVAFKKDETERIVEYINSLHDAIEVVTKWGSITRCEERLAFIDQELFEKMIVDADRKRAEYERLGETEKALHQKYRELTIMECQDNFYDMDFNDW